MATFSVYAVRAEGVVEPSRTIVVRDGFSFGALLLGPLWFMSHRMWFATCLWLAALIGTIAITQWLALPAGAGVTIAAMAFFLLALEFEPLRRLALKRRGYALVDVAEGARGRDAEVSYLTRLVGRNRSPASSAAARGDLRRVQDGGEGVGLFLQGTD